MLVMPGLAQDLGSSSAKISAESANLDKSRARNVGQNEVPNLTGNWILNSKLSDKMGDIMKKARDGERPQDGMGGRGPGGGGPGGGPGGSPGGGNPGGGMRGGMRGGPGGAPGGDAAKDPSDSRRQGAEEMHRRHQSLEIFHQGIELNITDGLNITQLFHTDGQPRTVWTDAGQAQATATWKGNILEVIWQEDRRPMPRTRHYQLSGKTGRLIVTEEVPLPGQSDRQTIKLVYDRAPKKN